MRIALLGADSQTLELASELKPPHSLVAVYDDALDSTAIDLLGCQRKRESDWMSLLDDASLDGVIVGTRIADDHRGRGSDRQWSEERVDQISQLLQAEIPLLVTWPCCDPLVVYELDMIRQSYGGLVATIAPLSLHPAVARLAEIVNDSCRPLGELEQVIFERSVSDRSRGRVVGQIAEDADVLRRIVGGFQQVTASGVTPASSSWGSIVLQIIGTLGTPTRWSMSPTDHSGGFRLSIIGRTGQLVWEGDSHGQDSRLVGTGGLAISEEWPTWCWRREVLAMFANSLRGQSPNPTWTSVCQCMEVVDACERSVARGRRIDLTGKTVTEKDTFRGVMAAGGCFLIVLALLVLLVFAVTEGIRLANLGQSVPPISDAAQDSAAAPTRPIRPIRPTPFWAILLAIPLVGFLVLQFLQIVIRKPKREGGDSE